MCDRTCSNSSRVLATPSTANWNETMEKLQNGQMIEWQDLDKRRYYLIGPSLFLCVRAFIYPFNLIKTRLFMQEKSTVYSGTFDAYRKVIRHEGFRGLYKGFVVSSLGLISGQLYITTYELIRSHLSGYSTEMKGCIAGAGATLVGQTVTVPVDIVSQRMMMQGQVAKKTKNRSGYIIVKNVDYIIPRKEGGASLKGALSIAREIVHAQGMAGLYRGYIVSLMTYAPNSSIWWMTYGGLYRRNVEWGMAEILPIPVIQVGCGVCSGCLAATITNPLDVIRTRVQLEPRHSVTTSAKRLWQQEGICGLKKGLTARIMSVAPTSAILVLSYEWIKRMSLKIDFQATVQ